MNFDTTLGLWGIDKRKRIGLIFDIDELLYDNQNEIFLAYRSLLDCRNVSIDKDESFSGKDLFDIISNIKNKYRLNEDVSCLVDERKRNYIQILKTCQSSIKKGVKETLCFLENNRNFMNLELAYASASEEVFVNIILKKVFDECGLDTYLLNPNLFFSSRNDQTVSTCWKPGMKKKPHSMIYDLTISKMEIQKSQCIAFEDSVSGVESAKKAGVSVIVIPSEANIKKFNHLKVNEFSSDRICRMESLLDFYAILPSLGFRRTEVSFAKS